MYCSNSPISRYDPDGLRDKMKMSAAGIDMLKLLENPPFENGMTGLHDPGDGTVTYGYGEVVGSGKITPEMEAQYPPMTEAQATQRLKEEVLPDYENQLNNRLGNRSVDGLTQPEFDALLSVEYNTGNAGPLIDAIQEIDDKYDPIPYGGDWGASKDAEIADAFRDYESAGYEGLEARREAEAELYTSGDYCDEIPY